MKKIKNNPQNFKPFYIQSQEDEVEYHFYDKDGNELEHTIEELGKCVRYKRKGVPTKDKYFFYKTVDDSDYPFFPPKSIWSENIKVQYQLNTISWELGQGKNNTRKIKATNFMKENEDIFVTIPKNKGIEWYIPSWEEAIELQKYFKSKNLWLHKRNIWTSSEIYRNLAIIIDLENGKEDSFFKNQKSSQVETVYIFSI